MENICKTCGDAMDIRDCLTYEQGEYYCYHCEHAAHAKSTTEFPFKLGAIGRDAKNRERNKRNLKILMAAMDGADKIEWAEALSLFGWNWRDNDKLRRMIRESEELDTYRATWDENMIIGRIK